MRRIKKHIRNIKFYFQNKEKIKIAKRAVQKELGKLIFRLSSVGGADINYLLIKEDKKFAMLRLSLLDKKGEGYSPILRYEKEKRLAKEYQAYSLGSKQNLTPKILYYSELGLACEYLHGERAFDILQKDKSKVWYMLSAAVKTYRKLHDLGITHLDATLRNFIIEGNQMKVIDFEYYPSGDFKIESQKAYDYIRIIEHTLRKIPTLYQDKYVDFINVLDEIVPAEVKDADLTSIAVRIENIENFPIYVDLKKRIFKNFPKTQKKENK